MVADQDLSQRQPWCLKAPCLTSWAQCRTQWQSPALITQRSSGTSRLLLSVTPNCSSLCLSCIFPSLPRCPMSSVIMPHKELWGTIMYCGKKSLPFLGANQKTPTYVCLLNVPVLRLTPALVKSFSSKEPSVLRSRWLQSLSTDLGQWCSRTVDYYVLFCCFPITPRLCKLPIVELCLVTSAI